MFLRRGFSIFLILSVVFSLSSPDPCYAQFWKKTGHVIKEGLGGVGDTTKQVLAKFGKKTVEEITSAVTSAVTTTAICVTVGGVVGFMTAGPVGVVLGVKVGSAVSTILTVGKLVKETSKFVEGLGGLKHSSQTKKEDREKLKTLSKKIAITTKAISGIRERTRKNRISGRRPAWDRKDIGSFAQYRRMNQERIKRQKKQIKSQITMQKTFPEAYRQALLRAFRSRDWDRFCSLVEEYYESGILPRELHGPAKTLISCYHEARKTHSRGEFNRVFNQYIEKYASKTYKALKERAK